MDKRALGDLTLGRVVETELPEFPLEELVPQATATAIAPQRHWLEATGAIDPASGYAMPPVVAAGQAVMVETDHALDDEVWLEPLPGHTPGHVGIHLASGGAEAVMCGDAMHSPIQCAHPEWSASACVDPVHSAATRRAFLERYCETGVLVLTAHFPSPSIGFVEREGGAYRFAYQAWHD